MRVAERTNFQGAARSVSAKKTPRVSLVAAVTLFLIAGLLQYALSAWNILKTGELALGVLHADAKADAGPLRYAKDLLIVLWGLLWPIVVIRGEVVRRWGGFIRMYFLWLLTVLTLGILPFLLEMSPLFFLPSGIRWVALLHACVGLLVLAASSPLDLRQQRYLQFVLAGTVAINALFVMRQLSVASLQSLTLGAARLTGIFSHAGVSANFAIGVALIASQLDGIRQRSRIAIILSCGFIALAAGSRGGILIIALLLLWTAYAGGRGNATVPMRRLGIAAVAVYLLVYGYPWMIEKIGRGEMFSQQFEKGGRAANTADAIDMLLQAQPLEFLFGRGLGIGTNTAIGQLISSGADPTSYRFNLLVDNSTITVFYQLGLIGSAVFWLGLLTGIGRIGSRYSVRRAGYRITSLIFVANALVTNIFESYFFMIGVSIALGLAAARRGDVLPRAAHMPSNRVQTIRTGRLFRPIPG